MNIINNINLEPLQVLRVIIKTKSLTESSKRLGVTQSATSHTLKKLREQLGDEVVFREGNSLVLTTRAQELERPLDRWLGEIGDVLFQKTFEPKTSEKVFNVAKTDIVEQLFAPAITLKLQKLAPKIKLRFVKWEYPSVHHQLLNSEVDLGIGVRSYDSPNIMQTKLYNENFVVADIK